MKQCHIYSSQHRRLGLTEVPLETCNFGIAYDDLSCATYIYIAAATCQSRIVAMSSKWGKDLPLRSSTCSLGAITFSISLISSSEFSHSKIN